VHLPRGISCVRGRAGMAAPWERGVSAALDGAGDVRWGERGWLRTEAVPETGVNLMAAARLCSQAALSCSAVPLEECSRLLQYEGSLFRSPTAEGIGAGVPPAFASPAGEGSGHGVEPWSSPEAGPCFCRAAAGITQQCSEAP